MQRFYPIKLSLFLLMAMPAAAFAAYDDGLAGVKMAMEYRADNWDMFTNVKVDRIEFRQSATGENFYHLDGMLGWYNNQYLLEAPVAEYDSDGGLLTIHPGQSVISRENITWHLFNMADEDNMDERPVMLLLDDEGVFRHVASGRHNGESYSSVGFVVATDEEEIPDTEEVEVKFLYMLLNPVIHPYNGKMTYDFVAQNGNRYAQESVVYSWVHGNNLVVRNWSDTGFSYNVFFTIDREAKTVTATNQVCLDDPDMLGECTLSQATDDGNAILGDDNKLQLRGNFVNEVIDGQLQTVVTFPVWGCFNERGYNFFVPTKNTRLYVGYDILSPPAAVDKVIAGTADEDAPVEYYTLQGVKISNPGAGLYIRRCGKNVEKVMIRE